MKKAGMIALLVATLGIGALGIACGDGKPTTPTNPDSSSTGSSTGTATTPPAASS